MTRRVRILTFLLFGAGLFALLGYGLLGLAPFGHYPGPYGDIINRIAVPERHVLNVVTAVIFDYRGFDTLGEEFILFACVTGVTLLMRHEGKEGGEEECAPQQNQEPQPSGVIPSEASEATRFFTAGFIGLILVFGTYIVLTGHLSLGGGFQGGVILAGAWLMLFLAYGSEAFEHFGGQYVAEWFESAGAGTYALVGLAGLVFGKSFLANILPLGQTGDLLSSGTILLINCGVGCEVTAGFVLLLGEFLKPLEKKKPAR